uniref:Truncated DNA polymerase n=1 Tax=Rhizophagus sp. DAOM 213198 TaxID=1417302 RepID=A0A0A7BV12_9GLOM|nr:truncated DNA polymerase [Rhizophagus sp. DAOM 213198]
MSTYIVENPRDAEIFIKGKDIHKVKADELKVDRPTGKTINHGLRYSMGKLLLASRLKLPVIESDRLVKEYWRFNPELYQFRSELRNASSFETPLFKRKVVLTGHAKVNWVVQGSCAELIWLALQHLYNKCQDRVKILPHFHDELVLKQHSKVPCEPMKRLKSEVENLYPFTWPDTSIKVFKLEVK